MDQFLVGLASFMAVITIYFWLVRGKTSPDHKRVEAALVSPDRLHRRGSGARLRGSELSTMLAEYWPSVLAGVTVAGTVMFGHSALVRKRKAAIKALAKPATAPVKDLEFDSPSQKRASIRREGNPTKIHVALSGITSNHIVGYVVDRSLGGLGISLEKEFEPGTILAVRPTAALAMTPWYDVEVLRCQKEGHGWHISCRFVRTPPYSIFLLFG